MKKKTKYKCLNCGNTFDERFDAEDCCIPKIEEFEVYVCPDCKMEHDTEKEASACCNQTIL